MKLRTRFQQLPIRFDADRLAAEVAALPAQAWRPHPQGYPGNDALPLITTDGDPASDAREGAMGPTPHLLACTYLMQVLGELGATWGRSRLMRLSGSAEVTPHVDTDYYWRDRMRVHVPIVTQPTVRFRCGGEETHMGAGEAWIFDTWSLHSVHNDATQARIHLVADTVGGDGLLTLIEQGRSPAETKPGWSARAAPPRPGPPPDLAYESRNAPDVMTPWELRDHLGFLMSEVAQGDARAAAVGQALNRLRANWHAMWARSGNEDTARTEYAALLSTTWSRLQALGADEVVLRNGMSLGRCLRALVFESALRGSSRAMDAETRAAPSAAQPTGPAPRRAVGEDPVFDRPIFIVSPPRSGSSLLFETLAGAPDLLTVGGESHRLMETIPALDPAARGWTSNRMTAADADAGAIATLRERFRGALRDRDGAPPRSERARMLEKTPKNALRVPFLAAAFPEARFVYLHRDPRPTLASMIEGWRSGGFRTYPRLPGWRGLPWSFLLIPGWRDLADAPLEQIVATQWAVTTRILLDDLAALPRERWVSVSYEAFVAAPQDEILRLASTLELTWDRVLGAKLPLSRHTLSPPDADKWRKHAAVLEPVLERVAGESVRARALVS
jgi:Sulfotransferase family/Aspartyl/Asparaginyl beta-hydroxylase